ncbi:hypothetical protein J6590_107517, partial [Homalodisca vitripennis]
PRPLVSRHAASWVSSSPPPSRPVAALGPSPSAVHCPLCLLPTPCHRFLEGEFPQIFRRRDICGAPSSQCLVVRADSPGAGMPSGVPQTVAWGTILPQFPGFHRLPSREYAHNLDSHVATGAPTPLPTEHFLTKDRSGWLLNQYMTYASAETSSHQLSPTPDRASSAGLSTPSEPCTGTVRGRVLIRPWRGIW